MAQILGILGHTAAVSLPFADPQWLHYYSEAARLAFADRARYVADPAFVAAPAGSWYALIAPAGTPPAIIEALNKFTVTALADPAVKEKLAEQGLTAIGNSPAQFRDYIAAETAKWAKVIKDAGVQTSK